MLHTPTGSRQCFTWRTIWRCEEERKLLAALQWSPMRKTLWVLYSQSWVLFMWNYGKDICLQTLGLLSLYMGRAVVMKWLISRSACPQQIVFSSVLDTSSSNSSSSAVFSRQHIVLLTLTVSPPLPVCRGSRGCFLLLFDTNSLCWFNITSKQMFFSLFSLSTVLPVLIPLYLARLGLYLRAGFQGTAVWSSHFTWLQDALRLIQEASVPQWVQPLTTRGRQRLSRDHTALQRRDQAKDRAEGAPLTKSVLSLQCVMKAGRCWCWLLYNTECNTDKNRPGIFFSLDEC